MIRKWPHPVGMVKEDRGDWMNEKEQIINRLFALENKIMAPYVYPVWYENWIKSWMMKYLSLKELSEMRLDLRRYYRQKEVNRKSVLSKGSNQ